MTEKPTSTRVTLASRPLGKPTEANFQIDRKPVREIADGEVLLQILFLSLDPYMRGRMDDAKSYAAPVGIGDVMEGGTVARVLESRNRSYTPGDIVLSHSGWQSHAVANGNDLRKLDPEKAPVSTALGVLGMPGFTAYAGCAISASQRPERPWWLQQRAERSDPWLARSPRFMALVR